MGSDQELVDFIHDVEEEMKRDIPYEERYELKQRMLYLGASGEVRFLEKPRDPDSVVIGDGAFVDGATPRMMDIGIDWHRYAK